MIQRKNVVFNCIFTSSVLFRLYLPATCMQFLNPILSLCRYHGGDFSGQMLQEALQQRPRPAFTQLVPNGLSWPKEENSSGAMSRKEKRQYKKRKHKSRSYIPGSNRPVSSLYDIYDRSSVCRVVWIFYQSF